MDDVEDHNLFEEPKRSTPSTQEELMAPCTEVPVNRNRNPPATEAPLPVNPAASGSSQLTPITMTLEALRLLVDFIVQNGGARSSAPSPRSIAEDNLKSIQDFMSFNPPAFDDSSDDLDIVDEWIMDLESIFDLMQFEDELRVRCAVFMLKGNARRWWKFVGQARDSDDFEPRISWQQFKDMFFNRYYPKPVRDEKKKEFLNVKQGNMSVYEYEREFEKLARLAPELVNTDQSSMAHQFVSGLREQIRGLVALQCPTDYSSALRYARTMDGFRKIKSQPVQDHGSSYGQKRKHPQIS